MAGSPSTEQSNYPRLAAGPNRTNSDQLEALGRAYYGLSWVFLLQLVLFFGAIFGGVASHSAAALWLGLAGQFVIVTVVAKTLTMKLAYGMEWNPVVGVVAAIVLGLGIGGITTYGALQIIAAVEMKQFGVRSGVFGFRKRDYRAVLAELRARQTTIPPMAATAPGYELP